MPIRMELAPITEVVQIDEASTESEEALAKAINEAIFSAIQAAPEHVDRLAGLEDLEVCQVEYDGDTYVQATVLVSAEG